ncbi:phage holin family protein [Rhodohalobacter sp.]|uniref:phage holin family protein n=1 Tax=Rhodohalobacter sp. TaxID=1974210 RepID=UPI002ACD44A6|nr:phage holin family protein [Rhodohalobacter sp.]MDZ7757949.1 phage holin family protein [Rhodohalobacter sp.]
MLKILLINSLVIFFGAYILDGVSVKNYLTALGVAILLGLVNIFIKPLIIFLTLPLTILTLGLFIWVINAWMLMLIDKLVEGFNIRNFWWALFFGLFISVLNGILFRIF